MNTRIEIDGVEGLQKSLDALAKRYSKATVQAAIASGQMIRTEAIKTIQDVSNGEEQTRTRLGGATRTVIASKAGDAPNTDTGTLVSSIQVDVTTTYVYVGSSLSYAQWLEFGTRNMAARPWLYPAVEKKRADIYKLFKLKIDTETRKGL